MSIKLFCLVALLLVASQFILITTLVADGEGTEEAPKQCTTSCIAANTSVKLLLEPSYSHNKTWRLVDTRAESYGEPTIATGKLSTNDEGVIWGGKGSIKSCQNIIPKYK